MEPIYVVLIINLIIWAGIFGYIFHINKKVNDLKSKITKFEKDK
jgi:CcmD family protein